MACLQAQMMSRLWWNGNASMHELLKGKTNINSMAKIQLDLFYDINKSLLNYILRT